MSTAEKIKDRFLKALTALAEKGKAELFAQGHKASGRGIESVEAKITSANLERLVGVILANDYLVGPVDKGVKSSRVPFGGRSSEGTSLYIQGLLNWARIVKPSLSEKERTSFVFAVAKTQKREGIPTRGAYSYTSNGRRTGWIENGIEKNAETFEEDLRLAEFIADSFEESIALAAAA